MRDIGSDSSRRDVLQTIGAVGAAGLAGTGTTSALADADGVRRFGDVQSDTTLDRTVEIEANGRVEYTVGVTGLLAADADRGSVVADGVASEKLTGGTRTLQFTGEFTEFTLEGDARVLVDGEPFDVSAFPRNTLEILPTEQVSFDVSASGAVELDRGSGRQPNARTVSGQATGRQVISYAGELTYVAVDGEATLRKNGRRVETDDVLPSTLPNEFAVDGPTGEAYTIETTQGMETADGVSVATDEIGSFTGRTNGRYAGSLDAVEHPSGARVEIDETANEVIATGPDSGEATVRVTTSKGLVVDSVAYDTAELTVSAGEEAIAVPFGAYEQITIDDLTVQLSQDAFPVAERSASLQAAARVERTDAFDRLQRRATGRVRFDAAGIEGEAVISGTTTTARSVEFALAGPKQADSGVVSVRQTPRGVEHASIRYKTVNEQRQQIRITAVSLPVARGADKLRRETQTMQANDGDGQASTNDVEYNAELFANTATTKTEGDVSTQGFTSFLDDVRSLLEDIGADVVAAAEFLWNIVKGQLDKIAVTAQNLVISSPYIIADIAENLPGSDLSVKAKLAWRLKIGYAIQLYNLASAGLPEALNTGYFCAGCVILAIVLRDVILSETASYVCFYFAPALPAAVVCVVAMEAIIQFGSQYFGYSDVQNQLCDGDVVAEIDPC